MGKNKKNNNAKKRKGGAFLKGLLIFSFLGIGLLLFLTKSSFFNIKYVQVLGKHITLEETLQEKGNVFLDENLLFVKNEEIKKIFHENPYVDDIKVKRSFPNKLSVEVKESDIAFYTGKGKNAYILSSSLRVLEQNKNGNLNGDIKNLIEITGVNLEELEIGQKLIEDENGAFESICEEINKIRLANETEHKITKVDLSNLVMIKLWFGRIEVRVGDGSDLAIKVNKALNILQDKELNMEKGYIDLSFKGSPIINREVEAKG